MKSRASLLSSSMFVPALAADRVSAFAAGEALGSCGRTSSSATTYRSADKDTQPIAVDGRIDSGLFAAPKAKSGLEVVKSFDNELRSAALSREGAQAVVNAIARERPGAKARTDAHGVGPLSPVARNRGADGLQLNRRTELISKLEE